MNQIKRLIGEAHRRSMWQVLGVYLAVSWGVYQVVKELTVLFGLPDWVPGLAIVLLLIGLPIVLATAFVQEGAPRVREREGAAETLDPTLFPGSDATPPLERRAPESQPAFSRHHLLFTWQKAVLGGICAFLLLGVTAGGYMGMRNAGYGPFGSLMASGELAERDRILVADFSPLNGDSMLAKTVTEAFRVDFTQSPAVTVVDAKHVRQVLQRMARDVKSRVDADLAHEISVRDNIRTYLVGEVSQAGEKYVVSGKLIATKDARVLASYRETAATQDDIIDAVDRLSKKLRNKIGESLRTIRAEKPLELVSTPSLEALQKYTLGAYEIDVEGDWDSGITLMEEAIELDSAFAMAWRKLAVAYNNSGRGEHLRRNAILKAYKYGDRLTDAERYSASGMYYYAVKDDFQRARNAYEMLMEADPTWPPNNLGIVYTLTKDFKKARETFNRTIAIDTTLSQGYLNLVDTHLQLGDFQAADSVARLFDRRFPRSPSKVGLDLFIAAAQFDYDKAERIVREKLPFEQSLVWRARANHARADIAAVRGRVSESMQFRQVAVAADIDRGNTFRELMHELRTAQFTFSALRDHPKAVELAEAAVRKFPLEKYEPLDRPYREIAEVFAILGKADRAQHYLDEYRRVVPEEVRGNDEPMRLIVAGLRAFDAKDYPQAFEKWRKVEDIDPCNICSDFEIALAFEQSGAQDSAIARYEHYVNTPDARRIWSDPFELASTYERLADLYAARGDRQNAARYAGKFVELWKDADAQLQPRVQAKREMLRQFGRM